ncbi:MAG: hypothetical protein AAF585_10245 [Verrucomicrobiota bacterium]
MIGVLILTAEGLAQSSELITTPDTEKQLNAEPVTVWTFDEDDD